MNEETKDLQRTDAGAGVVVVDNGMYQNLLDTNRFKQMYAVARLFAASQLVPTQYQGQPANCMVALQMAFRMQVDPMMFMQNTYIVHGRPGIEAKLAIALVNSRGPFTGPIQWRFDGEGKKRKCTAFATHKITEEVCEAEVSWEMVEAEGWNKEGRNGQKSKWSTLPDLMFRYRSAMFLARLYCPEVLLGMYSVDELMDVREPVDVTPRKSLSDEVQLREIEEIAQELSEAGASAQQEPDPDPPAETEEKEPAKQTELPLTIQARFLNRLGELCDGDEGAMLDRLHGMTGNRRLTLENIERFTDDGADALLAQLG
jgi:hypothetical protein